MLWVFREIKLTLGSKKLRSPLDNGELEGKLKDVLFSLRPCNQLQKGIAGGSTEIQSQHFETKTRKISQSDQTKTNFWSV